MADGEPTNPDTSVITPLCQFDDKMVCIECRIPYTGKGTHVTRRCPATIPRPYAQILEEARAKVYAGAEDIIVSLLQDRTEKEAFKLLEKCRACTYHSHDLKGEYCRQDKGCDKAIIFNLRIARRWCENWGPRPEGMKIP